MGIGLLCISLLNIGISISYYTLVYVHILHFLCIDRSKPAGTWLYYYTLSGNI